MAARLRTEVGVALSAREPVAALQKGDGWETGGWLSDVAPVAERFVVSRYRLEAPHATGVVLVEGFVPDPKGRLDRP